MDKSKITSIGDKLKSTSTNLSKTLTLKLTQFKDYLQPATPESRLVDQSTSPSLTSPDWGLNLRICSLVNAGEVNGAEIVRSIKRKIIYCDDEDESERVTQRLAVELLEICAMNCEKVFSEIAAERVVEEIVEKVIVNEKADRECKVRCLELVRAWGESDDLNYLPVFRQTYENLKARATSSHGDDGTFPDTEYSLESYIDQEPVSPPESYPIPGANPDGASGVPYHYGSMSTEQKKEFLEITRNSLEVLSSLLSSTSEPKVAEDDLTSNMLDKCKESQPMLQLIVQSTTDDEGLLFEALNLNDELQKVISKFDEMHVSAEPNTLPSEEPKESATVDLLSPPEAEVPNVKDSIKTEEGSTKPDKPELLKDGNPKTTEVDLIDMGAESSEQKVSADSTGVKSKVTAD